MKSAILTIRLLPATRRRLEALARHEGRSLSSQAERLIEQGMGAEVNRTIRPRGARPLSGVLRSGVVPDLADFREVRAMLSASLLRRTRSHAGRRR